MKTTMYQNIKIFLQRKRNVIPNWSEKVFMVKIVKRNVPWMYIISDLSGEEGVGMFYEKDIVI